MSKLTAPLDAAGLGPASEVSSLRGELPLTDGAARPALALTPWGLWLLAGGAGDELLGAALLEPTAIAITPGPLVDRLQIGSVELSVPPGRGAQVRRMIALARLDRAPIPEQASHFVDDPSEIERAWLAEALEDGEILLAWMRDGPDLRPPSPVLALEAPSRILITDRRCERVAISELGDALQAPRDGAAGGAPRRTRARLEALGPALSMAGPARVREVARLDWRERGEPDFPRDRLRALGDDPLALLTRAALFDDGSIKAPLPALVAASGSSWGLAQWMEGWAIPLARGATILDLLRHGGHHEWSVELGGVVHGRRMGLRDSAGPLAEAALDLERAEHLLAAGQARRAARLLTERLDALPGEALEDLLPEEGAEARAVRIRLFESLARARPDEPGPLARLAQLDPLDPERHRALVEAREPGPLRDRARAALDVLAPGGLAVAAALLETSAQPSEDSESAGGDAPSEPGDPSPPARIQPLSDALLEDTLQHPAARSDGALGRLQSLLASAQVPDAGALRAWCQRLGGPGAEAAHGALTDAAWALGVEGVQGYISRGERALGVRAWEGSPSLLLLGGDHLDPNNPAHLRPTELRFALGAELAHVRFKHSRVTWGDVRAGAWEAGVTGLDVAVTLLPALRGVKLLDKLASWQDGAVGSALGKLEIASKAWSRVEGLIKGRRDEGDLAVRNEELVAAHRVVQITADRAGLALCGDLRAAIRAIFAVRADLGAELPLAERYGLLELTARRGADPRYRDLALRIGALIAFWLSDDYAAIRAALRAPPEGTA